MSARIVRQLAILFVGALALSASNAKAQSAAAAAADRCAGFPEQSTAQVAPIPAGRAEEPQPALQLPADVQPAYEALSLTIDPAQARFSGTWPRSRFELLDKPRSELWLHAREGCTSPKRTSICRARRLLGSI